MRGVCCTQNWLGKFCLQRGFMHSCIILQMGLVFPISSEEKHGKVLTVVLDARLCSYS